MFENLELKFAKWTFSGSKRNRIYRKLNRFLNNGVPLTKALDILWGHASDDGRKPGEPTALIIDQWRRQVAEGRKLGQAIRGWVPDSDRLVIEGGEAAGNLTIAIEKAMAINESASKIKSTVIKGLTYPVILVGSAIGLLVLIVRQVVPPFDTVLPKERWEGLGAQLAFVANLVDNYLWLGLGVLGALVALTIWSMPRWTGKLRTKFDKFPPWSLYRLVLGSGFMLTVAGMIKAGITLPAALSLLGRDANPWYQERLHITSRWVDEGFNLGEALHKAGHNFPDRESVMDLRAYAGLNKFDEALEKLGTEWLDESVQKIEMQTAILRTLSFAILGGTFIWIYCGIFSLQQQIAAALQ
jgi:type II secretory pathway component PulF